MSMPRSSPIAGISHREWQVLDIIWDRPHSSLLEVQLLLNQKLAQNHDRKLAVTTVATFVSRLQRKNLVKISTAEPSVASPLPRHRVRTRGRPPQEGVQRFAASKTREKLLRDELGRLLSRSHDRSALIIQLIEASGLAGEDLARVLAHFGNEGRT